jgi:hypothetical protein
MSPGVRKVGNVTPISPVSFLPQKFMRGSASVWCRNLRSEWRLQMRPLDLLIAVPLCVIYHRETLSACQTFTENRSAETRT